MESCYIFPPLSGNSVFQFKVSLKYPKPLIWRRVLVPGDYTFRDLHFVIQNTMGWSSTHMHKFNLKDRLTGEEIELGGCGDLGFIKWKPESTKLHTYFKNGKDKATYDYDLGFTWYHNIVLEKIIPADPTKKYPQCTAGRRATPPEDEPPENVEGFDPERFDAKLITFDKCPDYFKVAKKVQQSFKENSSGEYASDSSNFSNYGDDSSIRKKSGNTSSEVATTSTTKLAEQAIYNRQNVADFLFTQNSNETDSSKSPQKRKAPEDDELKSVPAKLIVLGNKDLQINPNTTLEVTGTIENSEADPFNSKGHAEDNVSSVTEDAEDYYGRFIASQMRNIKDLERREDLRIEIQQLVSKYRFKN